MMMDSYTGILPSTPQKNDTFKPDNNIKKHMRYGLKKSRWSKSSGFFLQLLIVNDHLKEFLLILKIICHHQLYVKIIFIFKIKILFN